MNRKGFSKGGSSNLPVPTFSRGTPVNTASTSPAGKPQSRVTRSSEDVSNQLQSPALRRTPSPGSRRRQSYLSPARTSFSAGQAVGGVRYITEEMIRRQAREENLDLITSLNLTLSKDGGKKIKYIENLDKLRKLESLNLSFNTIERIERLDKLLRLRDLNLSDNMLTKIEGLENLVSLQTLNLSNNQIEHIPVWLSKKLKSLQIFWIANNSLESLNEVGKLKSLPDLIDLELSGNPLCDLSHYRLYSIYHLRTLEVLDRRDVEESERKLAQNRFSLEEVQQLERRLEEEESRNKALQESQNKSIQERSIHETSQLNLLTREKNLVAKLKKLEQEMAAKDELLKKKTSDLNKASNKHYQLEQELAFYKIDSKFDSLADAPRFPHDSGDDSTDQESPYIGKARFRANQYAHESNIAAGSPQRGTLHQVKVTPTVTRPNPPSAVKEFVLENLDTELEKKKLEISRTEDQLKGLQNDLSSAEKKLITVTSELKKLSTHRNTPEPFREDSKYKLRQRLSRKMQKVNELRDQATQMETAIDRTQKQLNTGRKELKLAKTIVDDMNPSDLGYHDKAKEMRDKEAQVNELTEKNAQLQKQLETALVDVARETAEVKKLEQQLSADQIEQNEEMRHELDDIISGLSTYLDSVKGQSAQQKQETDRMIREKAGLEEKIRHMEAELKLLEGEASSSRLMQKKLNELEESLHKTELLNTTLQDEVSRSRQRDPEMQDRLGKAETEAKELRQTLQETERKAESEQRSLRKQLQSEREHAEKMNQRIQAVNRQDLETKKLLSQLEAAKAMNAGLRDQIEDYKQREQKGEGSFSPSDLKKRLKKFTHEFKTKKGPIEPQGKNDLLGLAFQELQKHTSEQMNSSIKELQDLKKQKEEAENELKSLKGKMQKSESVGNDTKTTSTSAQEVEEKQELKEEVKKLKNQLATLKDKTLQSGSIPVRIVYRPDTDSDRTSSLNTDEKLLFDELQKELLDLKRNMRNNDDDLSRKLNDAEAEASYWKEETKNKEKELEREKDEQKQAAELLREKQEARIQVIAQDLDQAQFVAESLQKLLEDRERVLSEELSQADVTNKMISAQEDELARLYDILERQRDEIENLNRMLDHLAQQGPDNVGPQFDDELWRLRQEVNHLKETLAMEAAYVQAMPEVGQISTQTMGYDGQIPKPIPSGQISTQTMGYSGQLSSKTSGYPVEAIPRPGQDGVTGQAITRSQDGSTGQAIRKSGAAIGTQVRGRKIYGSVPNLPSQGSNSQDSRASVGQPIYATTGNLAGGPRPSIAGGSRPTVAGGQRKSSVPHEQAYGGSMRIVRDAVASTPNPNPAFTNSTAPDPRLHPEQHIGTERREWKSPSGNKPSTVGKEASAEQQTNLKVPVLEDRNVNHKPNQRGTTQPTQPSAFEPVRPEPFNPQYPSTRTVPPQQLGPFHKGTTYDQFIAGHPSSLPNRLVQPIQSTETQGFSRGGQVNPNTDRLPTPIFYEDITSPLKNPTRDREYWRASSVSQAYHQPVPAQPGHVGFNPQPLEISYNPSSILGGFYGNEPVGGGYSVGPRVYLPSGPSHLTHYGSGRTYMPAGALSSPNGPARIYYSPGVPLPPPGQAPPPPPYGRDVETYGVPTAFTPVASGTPIKDQAPPTVYYDASYLPLPPSPIRPVTMEGHPRGILKQPSTEGQDESYLFCNVPEHHHLEDYIDELQAKVKDMKLRISTEKESREISLQAEDRRTVKRLLRELEERRDELEGLDLAIERQKRNLLNMKHEEKELKRNRKNAKQELDTLRKRNDRKLIRRRHSFGEDSYDEILDRNRQRMLRDELDCLDKTLAKRHGQLRDAQRDLKEVNSDLRTAKEEARETVRRYDEMSSRLQQSLREQQEIEKRADDAAVELVKATEQLVKVKAESRDHERKRNRQEKLLREINNVISKKDSEFKDLDSKVNSTSAMLDRVQADLLVQSEREKEMVEALRDSEDILSKRRSEINKMTDEIDSNRLDLEKLDKKIGRKKTELQMLEESSERRKDELNSILQDTETQVDNKQRAVKEYKEDLNALDHQKAEVNAHLKAKKEELFKLKEEIQEEEEVLQRLTSQVNKHKSELKHTFEMQNLEQNELENIKQQHNQKLVELERTQRTLQEEKGDLDQMTAELSRKTSDLDRLRQALDREKVELSDVKTQKQELEERISRMARDRDELEDSCKSLNDKLNTLKRNHRGMEEKVESSRARIDALDSELRLKQREVEETTEQKEVLQAEVTSLKAHVKDSKEELHVLEETIRVTEDQMKTLSNDVEKTFHKRDETKHELEELNTKLRTSAMAFEDNSRQEQIKYQELQSVMRSLVEREKEEQDARFEVTKLRQEIDGENTRLNKLISDADYRLDEVRAELSDRAKQLEDMREEYIKLQKETENLQINEEKFAELNKTVKELEQDIEERDGEKTELAKALSASCEEVQRLRKETTQVQEQVSKDRLTLETALRDTQNDLEMAKQEMTQLESRSNNQVREMQNLAEKHFNRASELEIELSKMRQEVAAANKQLFSQEILTMQLDTMYNALNWMPEDELESSHTVSNELDEIIDELETPDSSDKLSDNKENHTVTEMNLDPAPSGNAVFVKNEGLRERLAEEQQYLQFQLRQQMLRHSETMKSAKLKSEETIDCLRRKLNALQEVLFNTNADVISAARRARSRSGSPAQRFSKLTSFGRGRSPSPSTRSPRSYTAQRRSRSTESPYTAIYPERDSN